jgi:hypothetical protein
VSLQFSILKVLAGQIDGRAAVVDLNRYITLLERSGVDGRMKRLAERAPDLDIFGSSYVLRDDDGWQLTEAGHAFLAAVEMPALVTPAEQIAPEVIVMVQAPARQSPAPSLRLVIDNPRGRRRTRGNRANRFAVA